MPRSFLNDAITFDRRTHSSISLVPEVNTMARKLAANHSSTALSLACLTLMSRSVMRHYGKTHRTDIEPLLALQGECISAYMTVQGVTNEAVDAALIHLERASVTAGYLGQLPD